MIRSWLFRLAFFSHRPVFLFNTIFNISNCEQNWTWNAFGLFGNLMYGRKDAHLRRHSPDMILRSQLQPSLNKHSLQKVVDSSFPLKPLSASAVESKFKFIHSSYGCAETLFSFLLNSHPVTLMVAIKGHSDHVYCFVHHTTLQLRSIFLYLFRKFAEKDYPHT